MGELFQEGYVSFERFCGAFHSLEEEEASVGAFWLRPTLAVLGPPATVQPHFSMSRELNPPQTDWRILSLRNRVAMRAWELTFFIMSSSPTGPIDELNADPGPGGQFYYYMASQNENPTASPQEPPSRFAAEPHQIESQT